MLDNFLIKKFEEFRDLIIAKQDLEKTEGYKPCGDFEVSVRNHHLQKVLEAYIKGNIDQQRLLDWVNTIGFSDWYHYDDNERDCVGNIILRLEQLDERDRPLSVKEAQTYIDLLRKNIALN